MDLGAPRRGGSYPRIESAALCKRPMLLKRPPARARPFQRGIGDVYYQLMKRNPAWDYLLRRVLATRRKLG
jgi:hypothetical protein